MQGSGSRMPIHRVCKQGGRKVTTQQRIIDNHMLLDHNAERHDTNTATTASKIADEPNCVYFINIVAPGVKITSIINEIHFIIIYKREGVAPGSLKLLLAVMSFGGHFGQPVSIATYRPIGQVVPYWRMCGNWHGLVKKAAKTNSSQRGCCAIVRTAAACVVVCFVLSQFLQSVQYTVNTPTLETSPQNMGVFLQLPPHTQHG